MKPSAKNANMSSHDSYFLARTYFGNVLCVCLVSDTPYVGYLERVR
jgi:hypothetical protein